MRHFSPIEKEFLQVLVAAASVRSVRLERVLEQVFFTEQLGRALIIQPIDRFGYFYLKPAVYDDEQQRQIEINILTNLFSLIVYLREQGLIVIHSDKNESRVRIRCLSDGFRNPTINGPGIVLNERGDYTLNPDFIHDAANNVIYRGVRLDGDLYDLVTHNISGFVYVSSGLPSMIDSPAPQSAPRYSYDGCLSLKLSMLTLGCAMAWLIWQGRSLDSSLSKLDQQYATTSTAARDGRTSPTQPVSITSSSATLGAAASVQRHPTTHYGIDVSRWNAELLGEAYKAAGITFAYIRATYGLSKDIEYGRFWNAFSQRKILRGAYHFFTVHDDPIEQAKNFVTVIGVNGAAEMAPAVDFEESSFSADSNPPDVLTVQNRLLEALTYIETKTNRVPVLYTNISTAGTYLNNKEFSRYSLWIADWSHRDRPTLPAVWQKAGYKIWQRTSSYALSAVRGAPLDLDVFGGDREDLYR